jgi:hypothetical protein
MSSSNARGLLAAATVLLAGGPAQAIEDLRALEVQGQRGQSAEQTRRDRYECHNWAVEQTGDTPVAVPDDPEPSDDERERRRERVDRAIVGAAIGAGIGGLLGNGRHRDHSDRVLVGAAAGAAIGAATAQGRESRAEAEVEVEPSDYLRALTACLEGRGYSVHLPTTEELSARR